MYNTAAFFVASFLVWTWDKLIPWMLLHWQPFIALLSAGIAARAISKNQDINRRRATIDLIEKSESSEYYRQILKTFKAHCPENQTAEQLRRLASPENAAQRKIRREVQQYLNHYELVAIGVLGGSLHEKTYREWMMSVYIRDWNLAADYIQRDRWKYDEANCRWVYQPQFYRKFEELAAKWASKCDLVATRISATYSDPPDVPGTVDQAVPSLDDCEEEEGSKPHAANTPSSPDSAGSS